MEIFKVVTKTGKSEEFEDYLLKNKISFRKYPSTIVDTYRVECNIVDIVDAGCCILVLEDMPRVSFQVKIPNLVENIDFEVKL